MSVVLPMLQVGQTPQILHTPIFNSIVNNPSVKVVRIPSIGEGNCLFHSILTSLDANYNRLPTTIDKMNYAASVRQNVFRKVNDMWSGLDDHFKVALYEYTNEDGTLQLSKLYSHTCDLTAEVISPVLDILNIDLNISLLLDSRINGGSDVSFIAKGINRNRYQIYVGGNKGHFETIAIWDGRKYITALKGDHPYHLALMAESS